MKIGHTYKSNSDNYGTYNSVLIAVVDFRKFRDESSFTKWMDKYHPAVYFGAWSTGTAENDEMGMDVWVPLDSANIEWPTENKDCQYIQTMKSMGRRVKSLPIGITEKKLAKWLEVSKPYLTDEIE